MNEADKNPPSGLQMVLDNFQNARSMPLSGPRDGKIPDVQLRESAGRLRSDRRSPLGEIDLNAMGALFDTTTNLGLVFPQEILDDAAVEIAGKRDARLSPGRERPDQFRRPRKVADWFGGNEH